MSTNHRLSRDDFSALAAGGGGAAAIAALRAGQVSKHTVMILAILDLAPEVCPDATVVLEAGYELLVSAQAAAPQAVESVLVHPSVGSWAERCLRRLRGTVHDDTVPVAVEAGQLAAVAAVAAIRAGLDFAVTVPMRDGAVFLPTLGLATVEGGDPWGPATVRHDGAATTISAGGAQHQPGAAVAVPPDPATDAPGWLGLRRLRVEAAGLTAVVELDDLDPGRGQQNQDRQEQVLAARMGEDDVAAWQLVLGGAWRELVDHHRAQAEAIAVGLVSFIPLARPRRAGHGVSITSRNAFGRMALTPSADGLSFGGTLVHEFHHSKLNAVMDLVPLHQAGPERVYYAPWREDPRPLEGLLHGTYAFVGVTDYWQVQRRALDGPERMYAEFEFALWRWQVSRAAEVLLESGKLTGPGVDFVRCLAGKAASWRGVPVPDEAQRLADRTVDEHETRWRLRNLRVDPEAVQALALAWRQGKPCPLDLSQVEVSVVPQPQKSSDRIGLIRTRLARPDRFEAMCGDPAALAAAGLDVTEADIAYARDDLATAYDRYRAQIADDGASVESFAGLLVAGRTAAPDPAHPWLAGAPERVWAVYRQLLSDDRLSDDLPAPDLAALVGWLAGGEGHDRAGDSGSRSRAGQAVR